jgi:hypothetical protein
MVVPAAQHLRDEGVVAVEERREAAFPAPDLGVPAVAGPAEDENVPEAVQLAVLAKQMLPAEQTGIDVPDSQCAPSAGGPSPRG